MLKNNGILIVIICAATLTLSGCSERRHFHELQKYITDLKQSSQHPKETTLLKGLEPPVPVTYTEQNARSPFSASSAAAHASSQHPLQNYPVIQLHFKGTVTQGDNTWAFILAPDNKLYQVKIGDIIGDHYGKIVNISETQLEVEEPVDQLVPIGKQNSRIVTLQIKGPNG